MLLLLSIILASHCATSSPCDSLEGIYQLTEGPPKLSGNFVFNTEPPLFSINLVYDGKPYVTGNVHYKMVPHQVARLHFCELSITDYDEIPYYIQEVLGLQMLSWSEGVLTLPVFFEGPEKPTPAQFKQQ
ncbi:hypothetical protein FOL47_008051 [Perkinsus chesapeaki]|uniref:Uncharacterized protein n=1 Tax=Perkinsus chesapeaki TaxID=330153 RepID=A0A7J6N2Z0_PERCH|nr:hypothetical protein FOL47_008051 [Perkinsus chesapeaki]